MASPDLSTLLRQRQLMGDMSQTIAPNPQQDFARQAAASGGGSPLMQNAIAGLDQSAPQQNPNSGWLMKAALGAATGGAAGGGLEAALAKAPGIKQVNQAEQNIGKGINNRIQSLFQGNQVPPVSPTDAILGPVNPPTFNPASQQNQLPPGQMMTEDPTTGKITMVPRPQFSSSILGG